MNKTLFVVFLLAIQLAYGQQKPQLVFFRADTVFNFSPDLFNNYPPEVKFGGISSIEQSDGSYFMISDRAFNSKTEQESYIFMADSALNFSWMGKFFGVKNVEAFRFDAKTQNTFYAYETHDSTGIGFINANNTKQNIIDFSMQNDSLTSDNRGIESLMIGADENLWFAFESSKTNFLPMVRYNYLPNTRTYDFANPSVFKYPFIARNCIDSTKTLNGNYGNGVTEILPYDQNSFFVMERCFDGKSAYIKVFLAQIPKSGNILEKTEVFEFVPTNNFGKDNKSLKTDNMEGMTWDKKRQKILLVSDDNFNSKYQRTIIVTLKLK